MPKEEKDGVVLRPPNPPEGMQQADTSLDAQPKHDFDTNPLCEGKVLKIKETEVTNKRTGEVRDTRFMVLDTQDGQVQLWQAANLDDLFDNAQVGQNVWVLFKDWAPLPGGRRMRMFDAFYS